MSSLRQAMWFSWLTSLLILVPVVFMFQVYGRVVDSQSLPTLFWLLALVTLAYVVMEGVDWARHEVMREASAVFSQALAPRVFDISRYSTQAAIDLKTLRDFFYSPALLAMLEAPIALVFVVIMFALHPLLGFLSIVSALIQVFIAASQYQRSHADLIGLSRTQINSQKLAKSSLRNAHVVQGMGMYEALHKQWQLTHEKFLSHQSAAMENSGLFQATNKTFQLILSSSLLGFGAWILMDGTLLGGPGMLIVASTIGARAIAPLGTIVMQWRSVIATQEAYLRLGDLLAQHPIKPSAMALPAPEGHLSVESLVASAPKSNAPILRGLQFNVKPGEVLAVIGPSGSGKSTLAKLLIGVWPTLSGKVRLDGADVFNWDKTELGPSVGYVAQTVELFEGTIGQNISRFEAENDDTHSTENLVKRIHSAARAVGLHDLIEALPKGYNTQLVTDGHNLSGGQMQRVAIARAIYGQPQLLVLDEANSHLDPQGETDLSHLITSLKQQGKTIVLMTHRKALLALADQVLVLRDGQQQIYGPREDVLTKLGLQA
jgi:ATP-binding cassette, subfamily C, bacterial exporter for protease/lipase